MKTYSNYEEKVTMNKYMEGTCMEKVLIEKCYKQKFSDEKCETCLYFEETDECCKEKN